MLRSALVLLSLLTAPALAGPHIHKDAKPILSQLIGSYQSLKGCQVRFDSTNEEGDRTVGRLELMRPNLLRVEVKGDNRSSLAISDGVTLWRSKDDGPLSSEPAPRTMVTMARLLTGGVKQPLLDPATLVMYLLSKDAERLLLEGCTNIKLGPPHDGSPLPTLVLETRGGTDGSSGARIRLAMRPKDRHLWLLAMDVTPVDCDETKVTHFHDWKKDDREEGNPPNRFHPGMTSAVSLEPAPEATPSTTTRTPEAVALINRVDAHFGGLPGATVTLTAEDIPLMPGLDGMDTTNITLVRPNLFKMSMGPMMIQSNGKTMWHWIVEDKIYSQQPAPNSFLEPSIIEAGPGGIVVELFGSGLANSQVMENVKTVSTMKGKVSGETDLVMEVDNSFGPAASFAMHLSIPNEGPAWVNSLRMTAIDLPAGMPDGAGDFTFTFKNWKVFEAPSNHFDFEPGADWKKVDNLMRHMMEGMTGVPEGFPKPPDSAATGKPAPKFTLESLDGKQISLASLEGKIVILDFWATWCGPCRRGLPVLMEIARERAADGVVLWTVDLREKPKIVKAFIEKSKWDLNVLLDPKGDVASKYGVRGIPHTVLIGPDGNVLLVEVGFMGEEHSMKLFNDAINTVLAAAGN